MDCHTWRKKADNINLFITVLNMINGAATISKERRKKLGWHSHAYLVIFCKPSIDKEQKQQQRQ